MISEGSCDTEDCNDAENSALITFFNINIFVTIFHNITACFHCILINNKKKVNILKVLSIKCLFQINRFY